MGRYINWDDIVLRYPTINALGGASEIGSSYLGAVEAQVDGLLGGKFTVPFSDNNETVKDLCIDLLYSRIGNLKTEESKELKTEVMERVERLKTGDEFMITNSGDLIIPSIGDTIWSSTEDYAPVFGMSPTEYFEVDSQQIYDEENNRG